MNRSTSTRLIFQITASLISITYIRIHITASLYCNIAAVILINNLYFVGLFNAICLHNLTLSPSDFSANLNSTDLKNHNNSMLQKSP